MDSMRGIQEDTFSRWHRTSGFFFFPLFVPFSLPFPGQKQSPGKFFTRLDSFATINGFTVSYQTDNVKFPADVIRFTIDKDYELNLLSIKHVNPPHRHRNHSSLNLQRCYPTSPHNQNHNPH